MQCSCGGEAVEKERFKQRNKVIVSIIDFPECKSCGRVGEVTQRDLIDGEMKVVKKGPPGTKMWD